MTHTLYLNTLELSPTNNIYITDEPTFDPASSFEQNSTWRGTNVKITDIAPKATKIVLSGFCDTEAGIRSLVKYDVNNYNWNVDLESVYLIRDLSRRWKVSSMEVQYSLNRETYSFSATLNLEKMGAEGYVLTSKTGSSASSPVSVTDVLNVGDLNSMFEYIKITGSYSSGANLTSPQITHSLLGYVLNVSDILLDSAYFEFYNDYTAKHTYVDTLANTNKFTRNCNSSTNTTFDSNHLDIAANGVLQYRFRLKHPLLQDPILTLTTGSIVVGNPKLEVSPDGSNWWEVEKDFTAGSLVNYNLTKLAGYSDFYFRITTGASSSLSISYMKLVSWHDYGGQRPIPFITLGSYSETYVLSFSAGTLTFDMRYRDSWSM